MLTTIKKALLLAILLMYFPAFAHAASNAPSTPVAALEKVDKASVPRIGAAPPKNAPDASTVGVVSTPKPAPVPSPAEAMAARQKAVDLGKAAMDSDMKELDDQLGKTLALLKDFNTATIDDKLGAIDETVGKIDEFRKRIAPGGELQSAIQGFIDAVTGHAKRISANQELDPGAIQGLVAANQKRAQEGTDLLAKVQTIHAGMGPLVQELGRQRFLLAEMELGTQADGVMEAVRAAVDRIETLYNKLWEGVRSRAATS